MAFANYYLKYGHTIFCSGGGHRVGDGLTRGEIAHSEGTKTKDYSEVNDYPKIVKI
jgi:hypothetical protein